MARPLPGLDIIRFAAAAMVMMFHLGYWSWVSAGTPAGIIAGRVAYPELSVLSCGWVGVEIFFVLSGFVIAYSAENASTISFVRGRFLRLAPAAWLCATVTLVFLVLLGKAPSLGAYFHSMAFIPFPPWVDGVYWTLGIEISFYSLILGLLALRAFRRIEWLAWALCVASSIAFVLRPTFNHRIFELLLLEHGAFFALGVFAWLYLLKSHTISNLLGMVCCFPVCLVAIHHVESGKLALPGNVEWLPYVVWVAAMVTMILSVSMPLKPSPLLRRLGLATYPLYLLHDVCGSAIIRWMSDAGADRWVALAVATDRSPSVGVWFLLRGGCARCYVPWPTTISSSRLPQRYGALSQAKTHFTAIVLVQCPDGVAPLYASCEARIIGGKHQSGGAQYGCRGLNIARVMQSLSPLAMAAKPSMFRTLAVA